MKKLAAAATSRGKDNEGKQQVNPSSTKAMQLALSLRRT
jgi:hypothetical protein